MIYADLLVDLDERAENDPYHGYLHRRAADAIKSLQSALACADQVRADAVSSMRECEARMRAAEAELEKQFAENDAWQRNAEQLRSALMHLERWGNADTDEIGRKSGWHQREDGYWTPWHIAAAIAALVVLRAG